MEGPFNHKISVTTGTIVKTIFILILFWLVYYLRDVVLVVIASVVIASAIEPIIKWFMGKKFPRTVAVLTVYIASAAVFAGAFYFLIVPLFTEFQAFTASLPQYLGSISSNPLVQNVPGIGSALTDIISNLQLGDLIAKINGVLSALSQNAFTAASTVLGGVLSFVLIVVLSFYLAVQAGGITNFLKTITPSSHRKFVIQIWNRAEVKIGLWLQGQLLLGVVIGVITYLGLTLLGIPHSLLLAFIAGVFEIIPIFGPILASIPGIISAFTKGGFSLALLVAGFYLIDQQFESNLIYPLVVKKVIGVPPIISILALVIGAKLAGFLGVLMAVPVATIIMEFFYDLERDREAEERAINAANA